MERDAAVGTSVELCFFLFHLDAFSESFSALRGPQKNTECHEVQERAVPGRLPYRGPGRVYSRSNFTATAM
jgi:hypothetical protein